MSTRTGIAPLTRADVAALYDSCCEDVRDALSTALSVLDDLYQRHTGSMFGVRFLDEEVALTLLKECLDKLKDHDPYWQRIVENAERYLSLSEMARQDGLTEAVRERAQAAVDELSAQWGLLVQYPRYVRTVESLVDPRVRRERH